MEEPAPTLLGSAVASVTAPVVAAATAVSTAGGAAADKVLVPNWRCWHRWWSIRIALFWAAMSGLYMGLAAFYNVIPPFWYAGICVFMSISLVVARLTSQPGA